MGGGWGWMTPPPSDADQPAGAASRLLICYEVYNVAELIAGGGRRGEGLVRTRGVCETPRKKAMCFRRCAWGLFILNWHSPGRKNIFIISVPAKTHCTGGLAVYFFRAPQRVASLGLAHSLQWAVLRRNALERKNKVHVLESTRYKSLDN